MQDIYVYMQHIYVHMKHVYVYISTYKVLTHCKIFPRNLQKYVVTSLQDHLTTTIFV